MHSSARGRRCNSSGLLTSPSPRAVPTLGSRPQRQWSDRAILRTTPALLGLYSLIALWATELFEAGAVPRGASWYAKTHLTFSDAIAAVRYRLWLPDEFFTSTGRLDIRAWRHGRPVRPEPDEP